LTFAEELDHFEKTFQFGSKYHFLDSAAARARILKDVKTPETNGSVARKEDSFEYMQSWDVSCLGLIIKQIYLAEEIPNNSIAMAMKPNISVSELTASHLVSTRSWILLSKLLDKKKKRQTTDCITTL